MAPTTVRQPPPHPSARAMEGPGWPSSRRCRTAPPHVWGREGPDRGSSAVRRTTSTYAGKTDGDEDTRLLLRDGPPHAWGRPNPRSRRLPGQTPTGVGRATRASTSPPAPWTEPQLCGEETHATLGVLAGTERLRMSGQHDSYPADVHCPLDGPPRVWGVRGLNVIAVPDLGYTPTHVGKTASSNCTRRQPRNDPHVREEGP